MNDGYDVAQFCMNGHLITSSAQSYPQFRKNFCPKCGQKTITSCPSCNQSIQGYYHVSGVFSFGSEFPTPAYCLNCGKPYPWTESQLVAAKEYAQEIAGLSSEEKDVLVKSLDDIICDTPKTKLAATRFKTIMSKAGAASVSLMKELIIGIVTEGAKKIIWPGS